MKYILSIHQSEPPVLISLPSPVEKISLPDATYTYHFLSPDASLIACFNDYSSWSHGVDSWKFTILRVGDKSPLHTPELDKLSDIRGFWIPRPYYPWSFDSCYLALYSYAHGLIIYNRESDHCQILKFFSPYQLLWSPSRSWLLFYSITKSQIILLNPAGETIMNMDWQVARYEFPEIYWLPSGKQFFIISQKNNKASPYFTLIDAENQQVITREEIDPNKLVPYDQEKYKFIPRGSHSLVLGNSRTVGSFLDNWREVLFDQEKSVIYLSTLRPVSDPYNREDYPVKSVCDVEKKWITVQLESDL